MGIFGTLCVLEILRCSSNIVQTGNIKSDVKLTLRSIETIMGAVQLVHVCRERNGFRVLSHGASVALMREFLNETFMFLTLKK